jgi:hypothetical protein
MFDEDDFEDSYFEDSYLDMSTVIRRAIDRIVGEQPRLLSKVLVNIEEYAKERGERNVRVVGLGEIKLYEYQVVADIGILFKYRYDGEYWYREWEIGGIGFTYEPVRDWFVSLENAYTRKAHVFCIEYFRFLHKRKNSSLCWFFLSKLKEIDLEYSKSNLLLKKGPFGLSTFELNKENVASVEFDYIGQQGKICKCKIEKVSESVLEVVGGNKVFKIDKCETRKNIEIVVEIIGRLFGEEIKRKSGVLDDLVGDNPSLLLKILPYIEKEDEKRVVTVAGIDILHIPRSHDGAYSDLWDIGGVGFISKKKEEVVEYFRVLHKSRNKKSDLYKQIVSKLVSVDRKLIEEKSKGEAKSEVGVEFDISRRKSKYRCKISKIHEYPSTTLNVVEIHTGEKLRWKDGDKSMERAVLEIIVKVFKSEIEEEVRNKLRNRKYNLVFGI